MSHQTLLLSASDVRELLGMTDCIDAVERVLAMHARGETPEPQVLGLHTSGGGFHVKAAVAALGRYYFAAKTNGNFPDNPRERRLPAIQGVIALSDAHDGRPLAILDSAEITTLRTAAATGVAARHLARSDSAVATIVGCGVQGRAQLRALCAVRPIRRVNAFDVDASACERFSEEMTALLGIPVRPVRDLRAAAAESDVCVTCTPARRPVLGRSEIGPGTLVAAVGADSPDKQELAPELFGDTTVVVDVLAQCLAFGDLHHAVHAGAIDPAGVHAQLGEVAAGVKPGRTTDDETIIFDSTGTALQDVAAAALVYERALEAGHARSMILTD